MIALVGYTGFVGSNIYAKGVIDKAYNSKNIEEAFGLKPDLLIYSGVRSEKYLANSFPEKDMEYIYEAEEIIEKIQPKKLVLISTVDVLQNPVGADENCEIKTVGLQAYGRNRYFLEQWVRENYPDALIVRLPALFGMNIKKNFIYDFINVIPFMLKKDKFEALASEDQRLKKYYELQENGFYRCKASGPQEKEILREIFPQLGFTALNFTDSRNVYQFYPLDRLWEDICVAIKHDIRLLHTATEPVSAGELYEYLTGEAFVNELEGKPALYDYRTIYWDVYHGADGYICSKDEIKEKIKQFVRTK